METSKMHIKQLCETYNLKNLIKKLHFLTGVGDFIGPWWTLSFPLPLWGRGRGALPDGGFKIFHTFFCGGVAIGISLLGGMGRVPPPLAKNLLVLLHQERPPSRLTPNFYFPHQRFIPH